MITIHPPNQRQFQAARRILKAAGLDPTTPLRIEHTLIAEVESKVVGVGQIKQHTGCQELGSLVVLPEYQRHGIAGQLIAALEARVERPLYLTCMETMAAYYIRFGYAVIPYREYPRYFKLKLLLALIGRWFGWRVELMRKQ
ncbi:MAG: GNAT family N-acetyltransferase [Chloroflexota bacterium]